jgi:hypothetical protein
VHAQSQTLGRFGKVTHDPAQRTRHEPISFGSRVSKPDCFNVFEATSSAKLAGLYSYWRSKCGNRKIPARSDIDPVEIPQYLPEVFIAEVHHPLRFRFRLVGSRICDRWNENYTGKWLDELDLGAERTAALAQYEALAQSGEPRYDHVEFQSADGRYLRYWRLLLPLSADGHVPNMILGMQIESNAGDPPGEATRWI